MNNVTDHTGTKEERDEENRESEREEEEIRGDEWGAFWGVDLIQQRRTCWARAMTEFCCPDLLIGFSFDCPEVGKGKITGK